MERLAWGRVSGFGRAPRGTGGESIGWRALLGDGTIVPRGTSGVGERGGGIGWVSRGAGGLVNRVEGITGGPEDCSTWNVGRESGVGLGGFQKERGGIWRMGLLAY